MQRQRRRARDLQNDQIQLLEPVLLEDDDRVIAHFLLAAGRCELLWICYSGNVF